MRRFHLIVGGEAPTSSRIDFNAEDSDQALSLAENHSKNGNVELWEGDRLIAYMDSSTPRLRKIGSRLPPQYPEQRTDVRTS